MTRIVDLIYIKFFHKCSYREFAILTPTCYVSGRGYAHVRTFTPFAQLQSAFFYRTNYTVGLSSALSLAVLLTEKLFQVQLGMNLVLLSDDNFFPP